jgi:energy-converting hydrogenase A subunit M
MEKYQQLMKTVTQHRLYARTNTLVSHVLVVLPVFQQRKVIHTLERRVQIASEQEFHNEVGNAERVLAQELRFILEDATQVDVPYYGIDDETGEKNLLGHNTYTIDRARLATVPVLAGFGVVDFVQTQQEILCEN